MSDVGSDDNVELQQSAPCPNGCTFHDAQGVFLLTSSKAPPPFIFFTERYFSHFVARNCKGVPGNNVRLLQHSNGLCVMCIDPSHVLVRDRSDWAIVSLSHSVRRGNYVKERKSVVCVGKKKKNAARCQKEMILCFLEVKGTSSSIESFRLPVCVDGVVLEINPRLVSNPSLLLDAPLTEGFIAIINPSADKSNFSDLEMVWASTCGELPAEE